MNGPGTDFYFENADIGNGQLDVAITFNGVSVPAQISQTESNKFRISYKPIGSGTYVIKVYYDGQEIQGSPFMMEVIDAKDVKSSGDGLNSGDVGQRSTFYLNLGRDSFPSDIKVNISSPHGNQIQSNIFDRGGGNVVVEFTPTEAGEHLIDVRYFDKPISGSPFSCQVTDGNQILMLQIPPMGSINRPVEFEIDASKAGQGKLEISVNDGNVPCYVDKQGNQRFRASFTPVDVVPHVVRLRFNDREVPGSPWMVEVRNPASSAVVATNFSNGIAVNQTAEIEVRMSSIDSEVTANVTTPTKSNFPGAVTNLRNGFYRLEYVPREAGTHLVQVLVDGATVPGCPFVLKVYNPNAIFVTPPSVGTVGNPVEFTIDASKAGEGQLEIMVNKGNVSNLTKVIGKGVFQVTFVPMDLIPHIIDILFNKEPIPNTPLYVPILDPGGTMVTSQGNTLREVASNRHSIFRLHQNQMMQQQQQHHVQQQQQQYQQHPPQQSYVEEEMILRVTAPNGELVPSKMILQPDGDYKLDYMSKYTGRHRVEITSNGQPVMGSPFYVEIYDPNKIKIDGNKRGMVGEQMQFDIIRNQAGKAELKVSIKGPRGNMIRYEMFNTTNGERVWYTPMEPGLYQIYVLFGGLNVPGCPVKQDIFDSSIIIAEGEGLIKGLEDHQTTFFVDSRGQKGDLKVQVEGPNSVAKTTVTQDYDGRYEVKYTPMEPGIFVISIKWNGTDIEGSPFRPKISALQKVGVLGGWDSLLDVNNNMALRIDETKTIDFDARGCGQGQLTASLVGPPGVLPVDVRLKERDIYTLSFTPREEGEYRLKVFWSGQQLDRSPLIGFTKRDNLSTNEVDGTYTRQQRSMTSTTAYQANNQQEGIYGVDKVILTGIGLQQAVVSQSAEFHIDGTSAGPGVPSVKIDGPSGDVNVQCLPINPCVYKCTYYPPMPGIYSIDIKWADRMVHGSPFKVNAQSIYGTNAAYQVPKNVSPYLMSGNPQIGITPPSDGGNGGNTHSRSVVQNQMTHLNAVSSSQAGSVEGASRSMKAFCTGEGLGGARVGREVKTLINTTKAGHGVLTAQCNGPTRAARCRLIDPSDSGIYQLYIEPLEGGQHNLQIKFNKEHIAGSPFSFKVAYPTDPGKVKCSGPGIRSGTLRNFIGNFVVDTSKAGPGQLGVYVIGQRGSFNTELSRDNHNDKKIVCSYNPTGPGDYTIRVTWSGEDVPGSPFNIRIFDNAEVNPYMQRAVYRNAQ